MQREERLRALAQEAFGASHGVETEIVITAGESAVTRFANSAIHQNVHEVELELRVRAVLGTRVGVAISNRTDDRAVRELVELAQENARHAPEDPAFIGLPGGLPGGLPEPLRWGSAPHPAKEGLRPNEGSAPDPSKEGLRPARRAATHAASTAGYSPEQRARDVKEVCDLATDGRVTASGLWSTREREVLVANSRGVMAYRTGTVASFKTVMMTENSSGYAEQSAVDVANVDVEKSAREAVDKAQRSRDPVSLDPGEYPVVLEPYAVGTMMDYLAYMGLGASDFQEGRSWINDVMGERIAPESISLWDDGLDPNGIPTEFDYEGVPKQRVNLIDRGVAVGVVYDSYTAGREGKTSTGHALPAPNPMGPFPLHLFLEAGTASDAELLRGIRRGVWVTRFHYVNPVHPKKTTITGMTRDGTFLIENGAVTRPIRNFRFTQSVLGALSAVEAVGANRLLVQDDMSGTCVPALKIGSFRFSSATQF